MGKSGGWPPFYRELPVCAGDATWSMTAREAALLECVLSGFRTGPNLVDKQKNKVIATRRCERRAEGRPLQVRQVEREFAAAGAEVGGFQRQDTGHAEVLREGRA